MLFKTLGKNRLCNYLAFVPEKLFKRLTVDLNSVYFFHQSYNPLGYSELEWWESKCIVKVHNMPGLGYQIQFVMGAYLRLAM